jgi:hypothetical protein
MYWDVKTVKPLPNFRIYVEIENGRTGIFDLTPYLDHGVFRELRDVHYFNQVGILFVSGRQTHSRNIIRRRFRAASDAVVSRRLYWPAE